MMGLCNAMRLASVRPLVRYVDASQAVIDTHFTTQPALPTEGDAQPPSYIDVLLQISSSDGFHDEGVTTLELEDDEGAIRFEMVHPQRWWPAGMGEQQLYEVSISLMINGEVTDTRSTTTGLTSVRLPKSGQTHSLAGQRCLLVNSQECDIQSVISIDLRDEQRMLPVSGHSLIIVRGHYGPDVLYDAADRAGILIIQCVPLHPQGEPESDLKAHVDRLTRHPSLVGWCVGHLGDLARPMGERIAKLDPTHTVFMEVPDELAA